MVYLGHFSFLKDGVDDFSDDVLNHGYFTTVAEAENVDGALEKFKDLLCTLKSEGDIFEGVNDIFLDACVECIAIPNPGFLAFFQEWSSSGKSSISTAIRGVTDEEAIAYGYGSENTENESDGHNVEPFITFNEKG